MIIVYDLARGQVRLMECTNKKARAELHQQELEADLQAARRPMKARPASVKSQQTNVEDDVLEEVEGQTETFLFHCWSPSSASDTPFEG